MRINSASSPPTIRKTNAVTTYLIPSSLWSTVSNQPLTVLGLSHNSVRRCSIASVLIITPRYYSAFEAAREWPICYKDAHQLQRNTGKDAGEFHWGCIVLRQMPQRLFAPTGAYARPTIRWRNMTLAIAR